MDSATAGALIALGGVAVGSLVTLGLEFARRRWAISDRQYERRKEVLDRRCDQAEAYAQSVTQDFRLLMNDIEAYLLLKDPYEVSQRNKKRREWKERLDTRVFALGPSIHAISDAQLREAWDGMIDAVDRLHGVYGHVWNFRFAKGEPMDPIATMEATNEIWLEFSARLGHFYRNVDRIRTELDTS